MSGFLDLKISQWKRISITRSVALVPTLLVCLLYNDSGGTELDVLNEWLNVLQSVQIPFALLPVRPCSKFSRSRVSHVQWLL
jgi:natural resistance-associated macrophage protein